jgi:hypothetical protein
MDGADGSRLGQRASYGSKGSAAMARNAAFRALKYQALSSPETF